MKKLNKKGFTLIELLAVIVIMGILMLVAIPAISRYMRNARKDTYVNTVKSYVDAVRTAYNGDQLSCSGQEGTWYIKLSDVRTDLLDKGGDSPYNSATMNGYVTIDAKEATSNTKAYTKYGINVRDAKGNGLSGAMSDINSLKRTDISKYTSSISDTPSSGYSSCTVE